MASQETADIVKDNVVNENSLSSTTNPKSGIPDWEHDTEPIARLQVIDEHQKFT